MNNSIAKQIVAIADAHTSVMCGREIPHCLAGSCNASARQQVMQLVTGQKMPKAQCGINALETALQAALGVENKGCLAYTREAIDSTLRTLAGAV